MTIATVFASRRELTMSVARSQITRGFRSANSSDGYCPASIPRTDSSTSRLSVAKLYVRRTTRSISVTARSSTAHIATICWASTSSGFFGTSVRSIRPLCIRSVSTAHSSRSPRNFGKMRPVLGASTWCPARPTRCSPRATDFGDSTCTTKSTAPMSMPNSSELVQTRPGQQPRLQPFLDLLALLPRDRAVVRPQQLFARQFVQPRGDAFRQPPVVHEDQRRTVRPHQFQQLRVDRRPDRPPALVPGPRHLPGRLVVHLQVRPRKVFDRNDHLQVQLFHRPGVGDTHAPVAAEIPGHFLQRPLRCRQPDALRRLVREQLQPFERQRQVRAALRPRHRVDLVHDYGVHRSQHLARPRSQHQVERFRRRDEDVRRVLANVLTFTRRRIARARRDGYVW